MGFVNGLARRGIDVEFLRAANMDTELLHPAVRWRDLGRNMQPDIGVVRKVLRYCRYHLRLIAHVGSRRGSLIHVIGLLRTPLVTGILEGVLFRILASRYVLTIHNLLPHDKHTRMNKWLFRIIYMIPDILVVHTNHMKAELMQEFGVPAGKIVVMQHGLNDVVPGPVDTPEDSRARLEIPPKAQVLLFFGRIAPYKGVETLLDAFRELGEEFFLLIAGAPVNTSYRDKIEGLINQHPGRERIIHRLEFVDNREISTYFQAADALVMPYRHIDQSGVLFLALRFALPVIAFDVGALREYIQKDLGVLVEGSGAHDFADAIRSFSKMRERFSRESKRADFEKFEWSKVVDPLLNAYGAVENLNCE